MGWIRVGPCLPPSGEGDGWGEPGADGAYGPGPAGLLGLVRYVRSPLWPVLGAPVRRVDIQGPGWGEPLVPAEVCSSARSTAAARRHNLGAAGRRVRVGDGVGCVGAVAAQAGVGGPTRSRCAHRGSERSTGVQSSGRSASCQVRTWTASMGVYGWLVGAQVPRCGLSATGGAGIALRGQVLPGGQSRVTLQRASGSLRCTSDRRKVVLRRPREERVLRGVTHTPPIPGRVIKTRASTENERIKRLLG